MDGDYNNTIMKLFGISLTQNGPIENNNFVASIPPLAPMHWEVDEFGNVTSHDGWVEPGDPGYDENLLGQNTEYFVAFPVPIPTSVGGWLTNVDQATVDATGLLIPDEIDFQGYGYYSYDFDTDEWSPNDSVVQQFGPIIPEFKYGFDPMWNVMDMTEYTVPNKNDPLDPYIFDGTYMGHPKPLNIYDALYGWKHKTLLAKRILVIYNDTDQELQNVKIKIADQTLKGAICEITPLHYYADSLYYPFNIGNFADTGGHGVDQVKKDGVDYRPEFAKFWFASGYALGLENQTPGAIEELVVSYLGPAGTKEAYSFAVISQYVTHENGNYAGTDDDYMVLTTQTDL